MIPTWGAIFKFTWALAMSSNVVLSSIIILKHTWAPQIWNISFMFESCYVSNGVILFHHYFYVCIAWFASLRSPNWSTYSKLGQLRPNSHWHDNDFNHFLPFLCENIEYSDMVWRDDHVILVVWCGSHSPPTYVSATCYSLPSHCGVSHGQPFILKVLRGLRNIVRKKQWTT